MALELNTGDEVANSVAQTISNSTKIVGGAKNDLLANQQAQLDVKNDDAVNFVAATANKQAEVNNLNTEMTAKDVIQTNTKGTGGNNQTNIDPQALAYQEYLDSIGETGNFDPSFYEKNQNKGTAGLRSQIRVGQYTGKQIGSVPIFAGNQLIVPDLGLEQRSAAMAKAAEARKKAAREVAKYAHIDVPQQYQKGVSQKSFELIEKYRKLSGNNLQVYTDANNPLYDMFHKDRKALQDLDLILTEADRLQKLTLDKNVAGKYIPTEMIQAATFIKKGSDDIDYLLTDAGQKELNEKMTMIRSYEDRMKLLQSAKTSIDKDTETMFSDVAGTMQAMDIDKQNTIKGLINKIDIKGTDKAAIAKVVHEFVPEDRLYSIVEESYSGGNIYLDKDLVNYSESERNAMTDAEIEKIDREYTIQKGVDVLEDMIGEKVTANLQVFTKYAPRASSGNKSAPVVTPYSNLNNAYENKFIKSGYAPFLNTMKLVGVGNGGTYSSDDANLANQMQWAKGLDGKRVTNTSYGGINSDGYMMASVQVPNTSIDENSTRIEDMRFGQNGVTPVVFVQNLGVSPSAKDQLVYEFITGEKFPEKGLGDDMGAIAKEVEAKLTNRSNPLDMGTVSNIATLYYNGLPWGKTVQAKIEQEAKDKLLLTNSSASDKEIREAQVNAVSTAYSQTNMVDRLYITPKRMIPTNFSADEWDKAQAAMTKTAVTMEDLNDPDETVAKANREKLGENVGDEILRKLQGVGKQGTGSGGWKASNDPSYQGTFMFIPYDFSQGNTVDILNQKVYYKEGTTATDFKTSTNAADAQNDYQQTTEEVIIIK